MFRLRLMEVLESPLPVVFIEAMPGFGKRTLLDQWVGVPLGPSADVRLLIDGSQVSASGPAMLRLIWSRLRAKLDFAELPKPDDDLLDAARLLLDRARRRYRSHCCGSRRSPRPRSTTCSACSRPRQRFDWPWQVLT